MLMTKTIMQNKLVKIIVYIMIGLIWSLSNVGYVKYVGSSLAWFTLFPFIFLIRKESIHNGFWYSVLFGFSAYLTHFWWMSLPTTIVMKSSLLPPHLAIFALFIGLLITVTVSFFQGLYYVLVYLLAKFLSFNKILLYYVYFVFVGTVLDYFFPKLWADYLGYSQYNMFQIAQSADLFGISFITFLILFVNAAVAYLAESFFSHRYKQSSLYFISCAVLLFLATSYYGGMRYNYINNMSKQAEKKHIGLIQGNISGLEKRDKNKVKDMIVTYNELTKHVLTDKSDLIVWPESSIPMFFDDNMFNFDFLKSFNGPPLLFGTHIIKNTQKEQNIYNALVLLNNKGIKSGQYFKYKLLPFVEGSPNKFFNFVMPLIGLREFSRGEGSAQLTIDDMHMAVNICYEAIIPEFVRKSIVYKNQRANLIVNATNDSWFGKTIEPEMHLRIASFRAIENRLYMVRVTCTGYSAIIDATGNIIYRSMLGEKEGHIGEVALLHEKTLYQQGGWLFIYILGFGFLILCVGVCAGRIYYHQYYTLNEKKKTHIVNLRNLWFD